MRVRYFAGARAASGVAEEDVALPPGAGLPELVAALAEAHGPQLARVLTACSVLVDEVAWRDRATPLPADGVVDLLPPFAGG